MNDFLDHDEDYWLSMDDDNPPCRNPLDMVDEDKDIIGFPTPVWFSPVPGDRPWYLNALRKVEDGYKPVEVIDGWQEVDAIGSGCFMVARRVMEAMRYDQPFARQWGKDGRVILTYEPNDVTSRELLDATNPRSGVDENPGPGKSTDGKV